MEVSVESPGSILRRMTITVPAGELDQRIETRISHLAKTAKLPGFRPGKIPLHFLEKQAPVESFGKMFQELMQEYYEQALKHLPDDMTVLVFSDSIDWVKEQPFFQQDRFMFSEPEDTHDDGALVPYMDLCLMSLCDHAIIANSSMSWWGAWLQKNEDKIVIAPKMWFGSAYQFHDTKDLYCDGWKVI